MTQAQRCEMCICADPENCTQEIPGRLCKRIYGTGRTQEPSVDVRRWSWAGELDGGMWEYAAGKYVLYSDHDAALSSLRTELVAARAEIERLKANDNRRIEIGDELQAEIATLRAENDGNKAVAAHYDKALCGITLLFDTEPVAAKLAQKALDAAKEMP